MAINGPVVVDLFSGAGGLSLGFRAAGCRILAGIDHDDAANATFLDNFSRLQPGQPPFVPDPDEGDLHDLDLDGVRGDETVDIIIGGPPCQGFSRIGRAKIDSLRDEGQREEGFEEDPRNELYKIFLSAVRLWKPRAFVMENVPGMLSLGGQNVADDIGGDLTESGYRVGYAVLNSVWYGVPQFRERLFFVGIRNDIGKMPVLPAATHRAGMMPSGYYTTAIQSGGSEWTNYLPGIQHYDLRIDQERLTSPATSAFEALNDLPRLEDHLREGHLPRGDFRRMMEYPGSPHSSYASLMRSWPGFGALGGIVDHVIRRTRRDYETFGRMQQGDRYPQAISIATDRVREKFVRSIANAETEPQVEALRLLRVEFDEARARNTPFKEWSPELVEVAKDCFPPYPEDKFVDKWRKLVPTEPSWTVTAHLGKDSYSHIHYDSSQRRAISVREAARLQSFPDGFTFTGNMGDCYRQIGNAVPPLMSWSIATSLMRSLGMATNTPSFGANRDTLQLETALPIGITAVTPRRAHGI
jgi:DNA (cytosine-5)-methyltransferase 1